MDEKKKHSTNIYHGAEGTRKKLRANKDTNKICTRLMVQCEQMMRQMMSVYRYGTKGENSSESYAPRGRSNTFARDVPWPPAWRLWF